MENRKKKVQRGEFGYIHARKKRVIIWIILLIVIAVAIFVAGLFLNKMSRANIFTVIAILFVLPWAKQVVALVVLMPYQSVSRERYEAVKGKLPEGTKLYTDMVISSPDRVMHLDFIVVGHGRVIGLMGKKKQDITYVRSYLTKGVANWSSNYRVQIVDSEKKFLQEISNITVKEIDEKEDTDVNAYLSSLIV